MSKLNRTTVATTVLGVIFASPASPIVGLLVMSLLRDGSLGVVFATPILLAVLVALVARLRAGLFILPAVALVSVLGWGLLALSQANFD